MEIAILILTGLTLIATIVFPTITLINNRLKFEISLISTNEIEDGPYENLQVVFKISNSSKYLINIHKIVLTTKRDRRYIGYNNYSVINNHIVDENEMLEFTVDFNRIHYTEKPYKEITVYTNKKNYTFPIVLT